MHNHRRFFSALLLVCLVVPAFAQAPAAPKKIKDLAPTVLLISFDGFRHDYPEKTATPNLHKLIAGGVRADLMPIFPSKTFPNHYSIVTGLYAEHHGIVANNMWDPEFKAKFAMSMREEVSNGRWWGGEPIWVTARKQGQNTATLFWPGSEAEIEGTRPTYWAKYTNEMPHEERVKTVLGWFDLPRKERPTFLSMYFSDTDNSGHEFGPDSPETVAAISRLDAAIGMLLKGLEERGIADKVNIIVVADHGMAATSPQRVIVFDDYLDLSDAFITETNPVAMISSRNGNNEGIYQALLKARSATQPFEVYRKDEVPARWHFRDHRRITPVVAVAAEGWSFSTRKWMKEHPDGMKGGTHGYDNQLPTMWGIFIARGPAFLKGKQLAPVQNIDIYPLMANILGVKPAPNDASLQRIAVVLSKKPAAVNASRKKAIGAN